MALRPDMMNTTKEQQSGNGPQPEPSPHTTSDVREQFIWRIASCLILLVAAVVYLPSARGTPLWDDFFLLNGEGFSHAQNVAQCFTHPFLYHYYRPLTSASFLIERRLWGSNPVGYHLTNILLHVLTTGVCLGLFRAAFRSRKVAFAGAFAFAVQPVQVSAIAWIGGRTDALCTLFAALFGWVLIEAARAKGWRSIALLSLSVLMCMLSVLTKEQTLLLIPLIPLAFQVFGKDRPHRNGFVLAGSVLVMIAFTVSFAAAWSLFGVPVHPRWRLIHQMPLVGRTLTYYALLLSMPTPQWMHTLTVGFLSGMGVWGIACGYLLAIGLGLLVVRWMRAARPAAWFLAMSMLLLLPVSNVYPLVTQEVAPYRAGCAGIGVAALMGWAAVTWSAWARTKWAQRSRVQWAIAPTAVFGLWCLGLTWWGAGRWTDPLTASSAVEHYNPDLWFGYMETAAALMDQGQIDAAVKRLDLVTLRTFGAAPSPPRHRAVPLLISPLYLADWIAEMYGKAGLARLDEDDRRGALDVLRKGAALNTKNVYVNIGFANYALAIRDYASAERSLRAAIRVRPDMTPVHVSLGRLLAWQRRWREACSEFDAVLRQSPSDPNAYLLAAWARIRMGDRVTGQQILNAGIRRGALDPAKVEQWLAAQVSKPGAGT